MAKVLVFFLCACTLLGCSDSPKPVADSRTNDFALYDEKGDLHRLSYYNNKKGIVLFVQGNGCPIVRSVLTDFREIVNEFGEEDFQFFMIKHRIQKLLII